MIFEKIREELQEKIKVTNLEIIVTGTKEKPYFEIKYKEVGKEDYNIGYSSYDLNNVFNWKEECFEIVNQVETEYKEEYESKCADCTRRKFYMMGYQAAKQNNGWIPCSERLPNIDEINKAYCGNIYGSEFIVMIEGATQPTTLEYTRDELWVDHNSNIYDVSAWQPLPEPYTPKGE